MPDPMTATPALYPTFDLVEHENPLSDDGKWGPLYTRPPLMAGDFGASVHGTVEFAVNGSLYIAQGFATPIIEAYGCVAVSGLGAALESNRISLWTDPDYLVGYSSVYGGGISEDYFFRKYTGNGAFLTAGGDWPGSVKYGGAGAQGGLLGIRITPTSVEQWGYNAGAGGWQLIAEAPDTDYRGIMWLSLETEQQGGGPSGPPEEVNWTCLFAGQPTRSEFYRLRPAINEVPVP